MRDAEKYIVDYLKEKHPELDIRPGSGVRDILIRPMIGLVERLLNDMEEIRNNSDLTNYRTMQSEIMDGRAGNWFVTRKRGQRSSGAVRVYMNKQRDVTVREGYRFVYGSEKLVFISANEVSLTKDDLAQDANGWYFDVNLVSIEEGEQYNIQPGEFVEYEPINSSVSKVVNLESFTSGEDVETNEELYQRLQRAITVRNLINSLSINTVLKEEQQFSVKDVYVAGFGSPEMQRDYVSGNLGSFHIGNMTDIYVKVPVVTKTKKYIVNNDGRVVFGSEDLPVYRLKSFQGDMENMPTLQFETDHLRRFSKEESPYVQTVLAPGDEVEASFDSVDIDTIDNYVRLSDKKITTASLLVRGLAPVYVSFDLQYKLQDGAEPIDEDKLLSVLVNYIHYIKIGQAPEVSDIDILARSNFLDIDKVVMPLILNGTLINFKNEEIVFSSNDALTVTEDTQYSLSQRTVLYVPENITVTSV